jgi:uncharacterized phage protein gp47/JayE
MRLPEIRQSILAALNSTIGINFESRTDSITGQFIDTFAEREAALWELVEAVYHAMYPISATGINLDHAVSFAGVRRLFAQQSSAWAACYGVEGTVISSGSIISNATTQDNYLLDTTITITRNSVIDFTVQVNTVVLGFGYYVGIGSTHYSYVAQSGDTVASIANGLYLVLQNSGKEVVLNGNQIRVYGIDDVPFVASTSSYMTFVTIGSPGNFTAESFGAVDVTAGELTQIVSTLSGWNAVNNLADGATGRNLETDDELRLRYDTGVFRLGAATIESIKANLQQNIAGVNTLEVFENVEDTPDADGRPPHSIEVIVDGGNPQDIANQIFLLKAAGIDTFGSTTLTVVDSAAFTHTINFNRPTLVYIWVNVSVTLYSEEAFPDTGAEQIETVIAQTGNSFGIGKDIIIQRFLGPIYAAISGIGNMTITVARGTDPISAPAPGAYTSSNLPIAARELSMFDVTRVNVNILNSRRKRR